MAKAKIKGLDKAVDELFKDYKKAAKRAAQEATEKTKDDLYAQSLSCLVAYYSEYEPSSYNRTYNLWQCFVPYSNVEDKGDGISCAAGIEYDAAKLDNVYSGSRKYTPTDSDWIIDNYLAGIHPRTDGSVTPGEGNYENYKFQGEFVPWDAMQQFIDNYNNTFERNFKLSLAKQILELARK